MGRRFCHASLKKQSSFRIHLEYATGSKDPGQYTLKVGLPVGASPSAPWEVLDERVSLPVPAGEVGSGLHAQHRTHERSFFGGRLALALAADNPSFQEVYSSLTGMLFYNIQPRHIEDVATFDPSSFLPPDGSNLASVFGRLGHPDDVAERINEYLRLILPGLIQVRMEPVLRESPEVPGILRR